MPSLKGRSTILVPLIGATLVWYDFHLFGSLATTISTRFFTKDVPATVTVAYYSSFIVGLILRPLGALVFGRVGDRKGRKRALSQSLLLTGIAASVIALVPGYRLLGVAAPIVLLVGRLLQGIAFGGVFAGAVLYAGEWAPEEKRGFRTSWIQIAPILGLLLSVAVVSVIHRAAPLNLFLTYGWRFAFLPTLILFWLSWYMRRMEETPVFGELRENATSRPRYLRNRKNLKPLLTMFCVASAQAAVWYLAQFYVRFHLQNVLKVNPVTATYVVAIALLLGLPFFILFGALSDKIGRRKIILSGCLLAAVLAVPLYAGMQRAAGTHVATISPARDFISGAAGPTSLTFANGGLTPASEAASPNVVALTALVLLQVIILSMVSGPLGAYFAEAFSAGVRFRSTALSYNLAHGVVGTLLPFFSLSLLVTTGDIYAGVYYPIAVILVSFAVAVFTLRETVHGDQSQATPSLKTRAAVAAMIMVLLLSPSLAIAADFKRDVIYQIVTDRFVDGDPSNNDPPQSRGLFDATRQNWQAYWGGDLEGIRQKIPYLAGMGITAIWISPPSDNLNAIIRTWAGMVRAPYYAYQPRDLKRIEEHFGDVNNSWEPFDKLVAAAHEHGIKVIVDFAPNHSNAIQSGEDGALYDNGEFIGKFGSDPSGYFNHQGYIADANDPFETQYHSLYGLADINQTNPRIDAYIKSAAQVFQQHGADGFRIDALKHVSWGWLNSFANSVYAEKDSFIFGEWYLENTFNPLYWEYAFANSIYSPDAVSFPPASRGAINDTLYSDAVKIANDSGIALTDFPLQSAIVNAFGARNSGFSEIDAVLSQMSEDVVDVNSLVTFIDNHDQARFLSTYNNRERFHLALALLLTVRGIPTIYYGDEQYLHNDTRGGRDPYNRPMMENFSTTTPAYALIGKLSALRRANPAIAYGSMERRWMDHDVYVYERRLFDHVVVVAINKNPSESRTINQLRTSLPSGSYNDYLEGQFGGVPISVGDNGNVAAAFTLRPNTVAVWSYTGGNGGPQIGSVSPRVLQPGMKVRIEGDRFGAKQGVVRFGTTRAEVVAWVDTEITVVVPPVTAGRQDVSVITPDALISNVAEFTVLTAKLVPVLFNVKAPRSQDGRLFIAGNVPEMGSWSGTWRDAIGPMATRNGQDWTICASLPAGQTIQFRLLRINDGGRVVWAGGDVHTYTVPESGVGRVELNWSD